MTKLDLSGLDALIKNVKAIDNMEVQPGFFDDRYGSENDNLYVAQVAHFNNTGTSHAPRRPFMDNAFEDKSSKVLANKAMSDVFSAVIAGRPVTPALSKLGEAFVDIIKTNIDDYPGSNSKWWAEFKGFNDPLLYTGRMLDSVKYRIKKGKK